MSRTLHSVPFPGVALQSSGPRVDDRTTSSAAYPEVVEELLVNSCDLPHAEGQLV
jgi:hypothetical protein